MGGKGEKHQLAIADLVDHDPADDDPEAEARETRTPDGSQLETCEAVFTAPVIKDSASNREAYARGQDRHESRPKKAGSVNSITVAHVVLLVCLKLANYGHQSL